MNHYNYGKLRLSLKVESHCKSAKKCSVTILLVINCIVLRFCSFENSVTEETHKNLYNLGQS